MAPHPTLSILFSSHNNKEKEDGRWWRKQEKRKKKKTENGHSEIDSNELQTKFKASYLSFTLPSSLEDVFTVKHGVNSIDSRLPAVLFATAVSHSGVDNTKIE